MLSSEFQNELGALIRQLQMRIAEEGVLPPMHTDDPGHQSRMTYAKDDIDLAIVRLVALRLSL